MLATTPCPAARSASTTSSRLLGLVAGLCIAFAFGLLFTLGFALPADAQPANATLTIVQDSGADTTTEFTYRDSAAGGNRYILAGGESVTLTYAPGEEITVFQAEPVVGWVTAPRTCAGDTDGLKPVFLPLWITGQLEAGNQVTCTYTSTYVGTASVTFVVGAGASFGTWNLINLGSGGTVRLTSGQPQTLDVTAGINQAWRMSPRSGFLPGNFRCSGDSGAFDVSTPTELSGVLSPGDTVTCGYSVVPDLPEGIFPTITCLAGNGRVDVNVLNTDTVSHEYRLEVGTLAPRVRTVAAKDWWRSPVTGRPDGPISIVLLRDGVTILDRLMEVSCDTNPAVTIPQIQILPACRGGNGFVAWQFANPTATSRSYIITFDGVPNRSTTAGPYGASVRGVSGRQDGTYNYRITSDGVVLVQSSVTVACD